MTTINSTFEIGCKAVTIDTQTMRIVEFEVGRITASLTADGSTAYLYPITNGSIAYSGYPEASCFDSRDALMACLNRN